jgi:hypothetical protein
VLRWLADWALSWGAAAAALVARMRARATSPNAISPSIAGSRRDWGEIDMLLAVLGPIGQQPQRGGVKTSGDGWSGKLKV